MALLDTIPISGSSAIRVATVRSATPLMERKVVSIAAQSGSTLIKLAISALKDLLCFFEAGNEFEDAISCDIDMRCVETLLLCCKITDHLAHAC